MAAFSRHIVFADESGSPHLGADTKDFPIFVLNFLFVEKRVYAQQLEPAVAGFKFDWFGHDQVILHEREIRRQEGAFAFLRPAADRRLRFLDSLTQLVARKDIEFLTAIVDKASMPSRHEDPWSPYDIALGICMEMTANRLVEEGEDGTMVHVVFESRGPKEDRLLELDFRRVAAGSAKVTFGSKAIQLFHWVPVFASKASNSAGLQIADLAARPLGLTYLRPGQPNKAWSAMRTSSARTAPKVFP